MYYRRVTKCHLVVFDITVTKLKETCNITRRTFILETASSAWHILVDFVGCPSQTSCVDPRYLALNKTPSIRTEGSFKRPEIVKQIRNLNSSIFPKMLKNRTSQSYSEVEKLKLIETQGKTEKLILQTRITYRQRETKSES